MQVPGAVDVGGTLDGDLAGCAPEKVQGIGGVVFVRSPLKLCSKLFLFYETSSFGGRSMFLVTPRFGRSVENLGVLSLPPSIEQGTSFRI